MLDHRPRRALAATTVALTLAFLTACGSGDGPTDPPGGNGGGDPPATGVVSGAVVDQSGGGVGNVGLRLTRTGASALSATTTASGAFTFADVPVGSWSLAITVPEAYELASGTASRDVTVTDGGTTEQSFTLELFEGETVTVVDNAFQPAVLSVASGTEVRWRATTGTGHTVTPDGHTAFSRVAFSAPGTVLRTTLNTPGTYRYFCEPHVSQGMRGEVTVN